MRIAAVEVRSAIAVSRWAANVVSITSSARAGTSLHSGASFTGSLLCSGFIDNGRSNCLGNAAGGIAFQHLCEQRGVAIDADRGGPAPAQADDMHALVRESGAVARAAKIPPFHDDSRCPGPAGHDKPFDLEGKARQHARQTLIPAFDRRRRPAGSAKRMLPKKTVLASWRKAIENERI